MHPALLLGGGALFLLIARASKKSTPQRPWSNREKEILKGLLPDVRERAELLVSQASASGIGLVLTSGRRSWQDQAKLYAQGRTDPGKIVTNAEPGESWHNYGRAFDVAIADALGRPTWPDDAATWGKIGEIGTQLGLSWGGSFGDRPHFSFRPPNYTFAQAAAAGEAQTNYA